MSQIRRRLMMSAQGGGGELPLPDNMIRYWASSQVTLFTQRGVVSHTFANGVGEVTFNNNLVNVVMHLRATQITTFQLPQSAISLDDFAFDDCPNLRSVNLPYVQTCGQAVFQNDYALEEIIMPSLLTIADSESWGRRFTKSTVLRYMDVRSITNFGATNFVGTRSLDTLILGSTIPVADGFGGGTLSNIYVPDNMVDAYKADAFWSTYASSIKPYSMM